MSLFYFLCLMTYQLLWVTWYRNHPSRRTVVVILNPKLEEIRFVLFSLFNGMSTFVAYLIVFVKKYWNILSGGKQILIGLLTRPCEATFDDLQVHRFSNSTLGFYLSNENILDKTNLTVFILENLHLKL